MAQSPEPDALLRWLDARAQSQLDAREKRIAAIRTVADAERRQREVRASLLKSLGDLPTERSPLRARETGRIQANGYVIEKLVFESRPDFFVTANVYRPIAPGRYPAVLLQAGHTQEGKTEPQITAANLALQGYVALAFDPIGQGEREQTYLPMLGRPLAGGSVNEHLASGAQSQWIGQSVARHFIWDAIRAIDYLSARPDVDPARIGAAGCSGGGALTTWIGVLDDRVKAVAPACFINTYRVLFSGPSPHSEMILPGLLARGLDIADMIEATAPKPWLILATEEDFFTPAGTKPVYDEARRWYEIYGAADRVRYFVGPGPHGTPREVREEIYSWMDRWLRNGRGGIAEKPAREYSHSELRVLPSGHVEGRRVHELIRDDYRQLRRPGTVAELKAELARLGLSGAQAGTPSVERLGETSHAGYTVQSIRYKVDEGVFATARLYLPQASTASRRPAVLLVADEPASVPLYVSKSRATAPLASDLAKAGTVVLEVTPRTSPSSYDGRPFVGNWQENSRADLVGLNLPILRARDLIRGVDILAARPDVDPARIRGIARGVKSLWLLYAAVADPRIRSVSLERAPARLDTLLDRPIGNFLFDALIPGFLLRWDIPDLEKALDGRPVERTNPAGWMGEPVLE